MEQVQTGAGSAGAGRWRDECRWTCGVVRCVPEGVALGTGSWLRIRAINETKHRAEVCSSWTEHIYSVCSDLAEPFTAVSSAVTLSCCAVQGPVVHRVPGGAGPRGGPHQPAAAGGAAQGTATGCTARKCWRGVYTVRHAHSPPVGGDPYIWQYYAPDGCHHGGMVAR